METQWRHPHADDPLPIPLTERQLIEAAIQFANRGDYDCWYSVCNGAALFGRPEPPGWRTAVKEVRVGTPHSSQTTGMPPLNSPETERKALQVALTAIAEGAVPAEMLAMCRRRASGLMLKADFNVEDRHVQYVPSYLASETFESPPSAPFAYVLALLLDERRAFARDLRRCQLPSCRKLFMAMRDGAHRPRLLYCTREHGFEAHRAAAPSRVRRSRERGKKRRAMKNRSK